MSIVKTNDGIEIYSKEWRSKHAEPLMFHHGRPLGRSVVVLCAARLPNRCP